ncbi:MAG: helix-turn-helix domain-containing protein [Sphingomonas sp.]|jgi:DNA-binding IclR family transcriptional regulator|uniref:IclR family transcriptional regulator n=1 Tax=Sphingomonas sp. TaxID=28214 RepID=UPI003562218D
MARTAINSSAIHVFEVLRLVARTEEPLGVSEISRRLGLPASTVYRALITLEESDYLVRHQNMPRYELGQMPQLLNRALVHRFRLHAASRPHLRALAERTGETASLTVRLGWYGLRLAGVYGSHDIYHRDRLGEVTPLHRNISGLGILAFLPEEAVAAYRTFIARRHPDDAGGDWEASLATVRAAGLAQRSTGEDQSAFALPVRDPDGQVLASIAISGSDLAAADDEDVARGVRDALEAEIALEPSGFDSPFAHIPPDEIVINLDRTVAPA